jgi:hypothetical protein
MDIRGVSELHEPRGWWATYRYPVVLCQEFHPSEWSNFLSFMADIDMFRSQCLKERLHWIKEENIKAHCDIEVHKKNTESNENVIFYRIIMAFRCSKEAEAYKQRWT